MVCSTTLFMHANDVPPMNDSQFYEQQLEQENQAIMWENMAWGAGIGGVIPFLYSTARAFSQSKLPLRQKLKIVGLATLSGVFCSGFATTLIPQCLSSVNFPNNIPDYMHWDNVAVVGGGVVGTIAGVYVSRELNKQLKPHQT